MADDAVFMARALELAARGQGATTPNPRVGAVLVKDGSIVAEGWHKVFGGAHAEVECLRQAEERGLDPAGATMYVTLEPCNHFGKTPPCSRTLLDAGLARVVIGCLDPNPEAGGGAALLAQGGVDVTVGVREQECRDTIADFVVWKTKDRPFITVKLAMTLDGHIATQTGDSSWVSGEIARARVHAMRAQVQAVMIGGGTLWTDQSPASPTGCDSPPAKQSPASGRARPPAGPRPRDAALNHSPARPARTMRHPCRQTGASQTHRRMPWPERGRGLGLA